MIICVYRYYFKFHTDFFHLLTNLFAGQFLRTASNPVKAPYSFGADTIFPSKIAWFIPPSGVYPCIHGKATIFHLIVS